MKDPANILQDPPPSHTFSSQSVNTTHTQIKTSLNTCSMECLYTRSGACIPNVAFSTETTVGSHTSTILTWRVTHNCKMFPDRDECDYCTLQYFVCLILSLVKHTLFAFFHGSVQVKGI